MGELMKTAAGRARIDAATERLDKIVTALGERQLAQGEKLEEPEVVVQQSQPPPI